MQDLNSACLEHCTQCKNIAQVIVDQQDFGAGKLCVGGQFRYLQLVRVGPKRGELTASGHLWARVLLGNMQGKRAALAWRALHFDRTAQKSRNLTTDREPKASSTILATRSAIRLQKGFEDELLLVRGDSNPSVLHRE